ncbi:MAG: hypothetical protein ABEL97_09115 [Salinibacter sp.]
MSALDYERGDARTDALAERPAPKASAETDLTVASELLGLTPDQYWKWLTALIDEGSTLDQELDELLDQIYACDPSFYSVSGRRRLRALLNELHDARDAVRAYEYDVEELTYAFARTDVMESQAAENATMALSQIKTTYDRAYDLCLYKMDRMGSAWTTASNFLISLVMLIVTILFWMEFR